MVFTAAFNAAGMLTFAGTDSGTHPLACARASTPAVLDAEGAGELANPAKASARATAVAAETRPTRALRREMDLRSALLLLMDLHSPATLAT